MLISTGLEMLINSDIGLYMAIAGAGYLLGSFPTGYVVVKHLAKKNILEYGTGNLGMMNVHRATNSKALTLLVLAGDMLKAVGALFSGMYLSRAFDLDPQVGAAIGGILAVVGHNYSLFLKLKGGKGIAVSFTVLLYFAPILVAVWAGVFLVTVAITRLLVVGQILATVVIPIVAHVSSLDAAPIVDALAALVFIRHAPRWKNAIQGAEPRLYYKIRTANGNACEPPTLPQ